MIMTNKRIIRLDSTSLTDWPCRRKFQFTNRMGLIPKMGRPPLDWGAALHRGIAAWYKQRARGAEIDVVAIIDEAVAWYNTRMCLKTHPRDGKNLRVTLEEYVVEYADDTFAPLTLQRTGESAVELPFATKIAESSDTIVLLTGKIDGVGLYGPERRVVIKDIKHSSSFKPASHMEEQLSRPQFHIYTWELKQLGLVDKEFDGDYLPIVIDCAYIDKKTMGARFLRSPITVPDAYLVERTMEYVHEVANDLLQLQDTVPWSHNYSVCHGKYSKCDFYDVCQCPIESQDIAIGHMFNKREYNPATFDE